MWKRKLSLHADAENSLSVHFVVNGVSHPARNKGPGNNHTFHVLKFCIVQLQKKSKVAVFHLEGTRRSNMMLHVYSWGGKLCGFVDFFDGQNNCHFFSLVNWSCKKFLALEENPSSDGHSIFSLIKMSECGSITVHILLV